MQKSTSTKDGVDFTGFQTKLAEYKVAIDAELEAMAAELIEDTENHFGELPKEVMMAYAQVLLNGGKRIRGALAMVSYAMFSGKVDDVILKAACALEMLNTYILIADDIQDRSDTRRGGKTAHIQLRDYHVNKKLKGDPMHFGEAMATNSYLVAQHYAANIIAQLPVQAEIRVKALQNVNRSFITTAHGQTMDLFVEANGAASMAELNNILEWKTAQYTFISPLQLGAIMAEAPDAELLTLAEYGLYAGKAFQLVDDIIGTFGDNEVTGKSAFDDIREGKRTFMMMSALSNASPADVQFLESCLGNQNLSLHDFKRCQTIVRETGALDLTKQQAAESTQRAIAVVDEQAHWADDSKKFLIDLANYLLVRES